MKNDILRKLHQVKLSNFADSYELQTNNPSVQSLSFDERLDLLLDYELLERKNKRINGLIKNAGFKSKVSLESIEYSPSRNLSKTQIISLAECNYIEASQNIMISGATGTGKSYVSQALGMAACYHLKRVIYLRLPRLLTDLKISRVDGSYNKLMNKIKATDLLIIDDFGLSKLTQDETKDFMELVEDRNNLKSCIIVSQIPIKEWYNIFFDPTLADAIMDRLMSTSYKIELQGPSLRKMID